MRELKAGDPVFVVRFGSWSASYTGGLVVKVTPKGYIDVKVGASDEVRRFGPDGRELGNRGRHGSQIDEVSVEERQVRLAQEKRTRTACNAMRDLGLQPRERNDKAELSGMLDQLQEKLAQARELVEKI